MHNDAREFKAALELLDTHFQAEQQQKGIPGISVAVVYNKDIFWTKGFGYANIRDKLPAKPQTIYRIGSITKPFTATMLMQLRDAGKLELDDPIEKYFAAFKKIKSKFKDSRPPTLRQVASHMAGLPREAPLDSYQTLKFPSINDMMVSLKDVEMSFPPMTKFKYSNLGYSILGHSLAVIAGRPYRQYVKECIIRPLGMNSTFFDISGKDKIKDRIATGYFPANESVLKISPMPDLGAFAPSGQLYSSVQDIARFISLQFSNPSYADQDNNETSVSSKQPVISSSSIREMHLLHSISADWKQGYGIGWNLERIAGHTTISHGGAIFGFSSGIAAVPGIKLGIAIFANSERWPQGIMHYTLELLIPIVSRMLLSRHWHRQKKIISSALPASTAGEQGKWQGYYVGRYRHRIGSLEIEIKIVKKQLVMAEPEERSEQEMATLIRENKHIFRIDGGPFDGELAIFEHKRKDKGSPSTLRIGGISFERK